MQHERQKPPEKSWGKHLVLRFQEVQSFLRTCEGGSRKSPLRWAAGTRREFQGWGLMFHPGLCRGAAVGLLQSSALWVLLENHCFCRGKDWFKVDQVGFSIPALPSWLIFSPPLKDYLGFQQKRDWLRSLCCTSHPDSI